MSLILNILMYGVLACVGIACIIGLLWFGIVVPLVKKKIPDVMEDAFFDPNVERFRSAREINLYAHQQFAVGQGFFWINDHKVDRIYCQLIFQLLGMEVTDFLPVFGSVDGPDMEVDFYAQLGTVPLRIGKGGFNTGPFDRLALILGKTIHVYEAPLAFRDEIDEPKYGFTALPQRLVAMS